MNLIVPRCIIRAHPVHPRFIVSRCGRVWTDHYGRWGEVYGCADQDGHKVICSAINGKRIRVRIHVLVLETFVGPRPEGMEGCHINDIPGDNRAVNLRWGTRTDNARDAVRNGRIYRGRQCHTAKLDEATVREIRERYARGGISQDRLAAEYGVVQTMVSRIVHRRNWTHI